MPCVTRPGGKLTHGRSNSLFARFASGPIRLSALIGQRTPCGRVIENVVPCGTDVRDRTEMEPWCFSTICLQTHRPNPLPVEPFVVKNGSNIFGRAIALIPLPLSAIVMRMRGLPSDGFRDLEARNVILPPAPRASKLLSIRFEITWRSSPKIAVIWSKSSHCFSTTTCVETLFACSKSITELSKVAT